MIRYLIKQFDRHPLRFIAQAMLYTVIAWYFIAWFCANCIFLDEKYESVWQCAKDQLTSAFVRWGTEKWERVKNRFDNRINALTGSFINNNWSIK